MRFSTQRRLWMSYRTFVMLNRQMSGLSSASGKSCESQFLRAQLLAQTPLAVDESVNCHYEGSRGKREQLNGSYTKTEYFGWPSQALGSATLFNIPTFKAAHPLLTWLTGQNENYVGVECSGSTPFPSVPETLLLKKGWDQVGQEWKPFYFAMLEHAEEGLDRCSSSFLDSNLQVQQRLGFPLRSSRGAADRLTPSLDQLLPGIVGNCRIQTPGLQEAGIPVEASSVKRKRKKKMNKHKQRKLRRRDRHRK